jgi:hypoxanthine phosphoribosyltransferase
MKTVNMSWNEFEMAVHDIVDQIKQSGIEFGTVYGQPRGGLILAVRLSHLLGKRLITKTWFADDDTLVVDDVVDTGGTLHIAKTNWKIASLYYNPKASFKPDFFAIIKPEDSHIVFPWENT